MMDLPSNLLALNNRLISAVCEDLRDNILNGTPGTPRADAVVHISRLNRSTRETRAAEKAAGSNSNDR